MCWKARRSGGTGDERLRALCEAVLRAPAERATLAQWAADVGASERTMARLFRAQLGTVPSHAGKTAAAVPWPP